MRILGLIPARKGSKGVPRKNIKPLKGKPLIGYTIDSVDKSKMLTKTIVSTDDSDIIAYAKSRGIEVPFTRPSYLADDKTSSIKVMKHAIEFFMKKNENYDAICLLQPTNPFRPHDFIDNGIKKFCKYSYSSLISIREVPHQFNPNWIFEMKNDKNLTFYDKKPLTPNRQSLKKYYHRDGALYLTAVETLINSNSLFGSNIGYLLSPESCGINIDSKIDWEKAEDYLKINS